MLRERRLPKTSHTMIRSASLLVMTGALWAGAANAQMTGADLVTRIDRLQAQVRELTGTVEELQYRNQQLEQEVQRLWDEYGGEPGISPLGDGKTTRRDGRAPTRSIRPTGRV